MNGIRAMVCVLGLSTWSGVALAQSGAVTRTQCMRGDCEYQFEDEAVDSPGYSAYGQWFTVRPPAKRVMLIRPRISFVMELVKSTQGL